MIVASNRIPVAGGDEDAFAERLFDRVGLVERHPGFVRLEVLRPQPVVVAGQQVGGSDCFIVLTYWARPEDFVAWAQSDDFRKAHAQRSSGGAFAGPTALEVHQVIQTTEGHSAA